MGGLKRICAVDFSNDLEPSLKVLIKNRCHAIIDTVKNETELKNYLAKSSPDLILLFLYLLDSKEKKIIAHLKKQYDYIPLLCVINAQQKEDLDELFDLGVDDFTIKPIREFELIARIRRKIDVHYAIEVAKTAQYLKKKYAKYNLIGEDPSFLNSMEKLRPIASFDIPVLLLGETGTGKELFARAIHYLSKRENGPYIPVNCGAIPLELFENELFGHARGAYTDARTPQKGYIAEAEAGTLFLDEVDTMPLPAQVKLLRFLQEREYKPLGESKYKTADIRIIAASNVNLLDPNNNSQFRKDLLYRVSPFTITIPALRDRKGDIPMLASYFVDKFAELYKIERKQLSSAALRKLMSYDWPGNIRELENVVLRSLVMSKRSIIGPGDFDLQCDSSAEQIDETSLREAKSRLIEKFERDYITRLLVECHGNVQEAADMAKIARKSIYRMMNKYKIGKTTNS